jgi:hypothetical protein
VSKHLGLRPVGPAHATQTALAAIDQRHSHVADLDHRDGRDRLPRPSGHLRDPLTKMSGPIEESVVVCKNMVSNMGLWRNR